MTKAHAMDRAANGGQSFLIDSWATLTGVGPARSEIPEHEKFDPASHRFLKLVAEREDGSRIKIELIRSVDRIREQLGESALDWANQPAIQRLYLRIPELRLNDYADVLAIESCPAILDGPGEVVTVKWSPLSSPREVITATYHTDRADVIDLVFSGLKDPLGATPSHPFWSVSRQSFIPAGELVLGDKVVALDGRTFRLTSITSRSGPEPVFNLDVANEHIHQIVLRVVSCPCHR